MDKELKISIDDARKAFNQADEKGKNLLTGLFGAEVFKPKDIMERIKTFDDAYNELGKEHPLIIEYEAMMNAQGYTPSIFMIAVMKLSIISAALNEGWTPQYTSDEWRYMPYFYLYTKEEWDVLTDEQKSYGVCFGGFASYGAWDGFVCAYSYSAPSSADARIGSRLCLKSSTLARYSGKQFIEIWKDFIL